MKSTRLLTLAALSVLALSGSSCEPSCGCAPPCPTRSVTQLQIPSLDDYNDYCFAERLTGSESSKQYVINSAADYEVLFRCAPRPVIDFKAYTLLAGKTRMTSGGSVESQVMTYPCEGPAYTFTVKLNPGATLATADVAYFAVVPKLPADAKVTFDVQLLP